MTHTPGPWEVAENLFGNTASYEVYANVETKSGKGGYTRICQITPRDQKANAHLISAAPDMLEALENLVAINEAHNLAVEGVIGRPVEWKDGYLDEARAAIRKARGEE